MFRNRKHQKPNEDFYHHFKQSFPNVAQERIPRSTSNNANSVGSNDQAINVSVDAIQSLLHRPDMDDHDDEMKGQGPTPRAAQEQWNMTPSVLDTTSLAFTSLANQPSAYYGVSTPTTSTLPSTLPSQTEQAADFATPGMGMNFMPPMMSSHPNSVDPSTISNPSITMSALHAPYVSHMGNGINPYAQQHSFAPIFNGVSDLSLDNTEDASFGNLKLPDTGLDAPNGTHGVEEPSIGFNNEDLRFHVLLRAPTAMIKEPDDIPITYLNKGQAYAVTVADTAAMASATSRPVKYRTFIRVSFEEEEQRSKPDSCWVLWQEGRGANEAHHRDGKLLAVEHVDPNQGGNGESRHPQIQLDCANFDGFAVTWTPNKSNGRYECTISVRFNFLSTDFSHSKGVKGIPVRLCAKTEVIATTDGPHRSVPEVSYCKVKLFRDHGAERKLSNDSAHVRKLMDKIKGQITQAEMGSAQGDKRKRSGSISTKNGLKPTKQKRSFSIGQCDASRPSLEDDLHMKVDNLLRMLKSAHSASHLNLRGDPQDDPDMFPVKLETHDNVTGPYEWEPSQDTVGMSQSYSPSSSHHSIASRGSDTMRGPIFTYGNSRPSSSRPVSADWSNFSHHDSDGSKFSQVLTSPVKIQRVAGGDSETPFEALGVDPTYTPPLDATKVPKYCFYVKLHQTPGDLYYHAIYLEQRTTANFIAAISQKWKVDPTHIQRAVLIREDGLNIVVDDDVVRELPEGKDMVIEFTSPRGNSVESMDIDPSSGHEGIEIKVHLDPSFTAARTHRN